MAQLHGKQIKDTSTSLDKLSGTGVVAFDGNTTMEFESGAKLTTQLSNITANNDVVNKEYVDALISGFVVKEAVEAISLTNITLSGLQTIDGVLLVAGNRVMVNGQTDKKLNGIYDAKTGAWTRSVDFDEDEEVSGGQFAFVKRGTLYADTGWVVSSDGGVIGTFDIVFTQFSSAGVITAGIGLEKSANEIRLKNTAVTTGTYGSATSVGSFTVDQQGRLTAASNVAIEITSSQVSDLNTTIKTTVFDAANFVDTPTIDFTVVSGGSVSAIIKDSSITPAMTKADNSAQDGYILSYTAAGEFSWIAPGTVGGITSVTGSGGITATPTGSVVDVKIDLATNSGMNVTSGLAVGAGNGISVVDDKVSAVIKTSGGLALEATGLSIATTFAGEGLTMTGGVLKVEAGDGISVSNDKVSAKIEADKGLSLGTAGLAVKVDDATIKINSSGQLYATGDVSKPKYLRITGVVGAAGTQITGTLPTPSVYSRLEVYLNGQKLSVGGNVAGLDTYGSQMVQITGGVVTWRSTLYDLEASDVINIVYEA